jgi:hypothetical protein
LQIELLTKEANHQFLEFLELLNVQSGGSPEHRIDKKAEVFYVIRRPQVGTNKGTLALYYLNVSQNYSASVYVLLLLNNLTDFKHLINSISIGFVY